MEMKIIDFERKGNVVRFYLGEKTPVWGWTRADYKDFTGKTPEWLRPSDTYYGDDWNDCPYEDNAGRVYDEFIKGYTDVSFDFDDVVVEPNNGHWSKEDMIARRVPCLIVIPKQYMEDHALSEWEVDDFETAIGIKEATRYYFGDDMEYTPHIYYFKTDEEVEPYIIRETRKASEHDVAIHNLYKEVEADWKPIEVDQELQCTYKPYAYFIYKDTKYPIYADDPGQQDCIYINGDWYGAGAYTGYPYNLEIFIEYIDQHKL